MAMSKGHWRACHTAAPPVPIKQRKPTACEQPAISFYLRTKPTMG